MDQGGGSGGVRSGGSGKGWSGESREHPRIDEWIVAAISLLRYMKKKQIDARNERGMTPLMTACAIGSPGKQNSPNFLTFPELIAQTF